LYALDPATHISPLIGLFSGGTMLAAFFVATDPVSAAASDRGRLIYGAGIGALCFAMRQWGAYPDGIAFAVLLMNMAVPLIDRYTLPRIYGHDKQP
jgi:electron transport complex protein RnfD